MKLILEKLKSCKNRNSTKANYQCIWRKFNNFIIQLDVKPNNWEDRLSLFGAYLVHQGVQSSTLKSYISGIKSVLRDDGYIWDETRIIISSLTRACRLINDRVHTRLPIQIKLLEMLLFEIQRSLGGQPYLLCMYQTIFLLAYYGMFRIGELTSGLHQVKAKDVHIAQNQNKMLFVLYSSKTHGKDSNPQKIKICANNNPQNRLTSQNNRFFCPFKSSREYLAIRGNYLNDSDPFFISKDNTPVKPYHVRTVLKTVLKAVNLNPKLYGTHSFRVGRCSDLAKWKTPLLDLKRAGRWRSNAVFKYIRN